MSPEQMIKLEKCFSELLKKNGELSDLYDRLSPADKEVFYPRLMASFNRTEQLLKNERTNKLSELAVGGKG